MTEIRAGFFHWTADTDKQLAEMVAANKTRNHMAKQLGCNVAQIGGRVFRLGLTKPNGRKGLAKSRKDICAP